VGTLCFDAFKCPTAKAVKYQEAIDGAGSEDDGEAQGDAFDDSDFVSDDNDDDDQQKSSKHVIEYLCPALFSKKDVYLNQRQSIEIVFAACETGSPEFWNDGIRSKTSLMC
jgi:hypothetical protein